MLPLSGQFSCSSSELISINFFTLKNQILIKRYYFKRYHLNMYVAASIRIKGLGEPILNKELFQLTRDPRSRHFLVQNIDLAIQCGNASNIPGSLRNCQRVNIWRRMFFTFAKQCFVDKSLGLLGCPSHYLYSFWDLYLNRWLL